MNPLTNVLSSEIIQKGYNLMSLGVDEYAWDMLSIKTILEILAKEQIAVLGGDVYEISGGKIEMTFDSWYIDEDGSVDFYDKSKKVALEYIQKYEDNNSGKYIYSITI